MKSTIEVKGYKIVIEEDEETISVIATKDDETIEEFEINIGEEGGDFHEKEDGGDKNVKSFDDFEEEDDFEEKGKSEDEDEDEDEDIDFDSENDDEEDEEDKNPNKEVQTLESFNSFLRRSKKR